MKPSGKPFHFPFIILAVCLLESCGTSQNDKINVLEKRIDVLEQKIRSLEQNPVVSPVENVKESMQFRMEMIRDIHRIAGSARPYFSRNRSYLGFAVPIGMRTSSRIIYTTTPSDTDVVIEGVPTGVGGKISVRLNYAGSLVDWKFSGAFQKFDLPRSQMTDEASHHFEGVRDDILTIVENVRRYRENSPHLKGEGLYGGYSIPIAQSSTLFGWYAAIPYDGGITIEGHSKRFFYVRRANLDEEGNIVKIDSITYAGTQRVRTGNNVSAVDSLRDLISADFSAIASRARVFRSLPFASGGGGGKFTGYQSAQVCSADGLVQYHMTIDPDMILLRAISVRGFGTVSVKIESNGNLKGWYYTGKIAE